jgi:hypothetical protein
LFCCSSSPLSASASPPPLDRPGGLQPAASLATVLSRPFLQNVSTPLILLLFTTCALLYVVIVASYIRIQKRLTTTVSTAGSNNSSNGEKKARRITQMSVMVVGLLLVCNTPIVVMGTVPPPGPDGPISLATFALLYEVFYVLIVASTFANNFLYAWHLGDFRRSITKFVRCDRITVIDSTSMERRRQ